MVTGGKGCLCAPTPDPGYFEPTQVSDSALAMG